jgi:hypothetical protein
MLPQRAVGGVESAQNMAAELAEAQPAHSAMSTVAISVNEGIATESDRA